MENGSSAFEVHLELDGSVTYVWEDPSLDAPLLALAVEDAGSAQPIGLVATCPLPERDEAIAQRLAERLLRGMQ